jgi:hypothetical protein
MRNLFYRFCAPLSLTLMLAPGARPQQQQQQQQQQDQTQQQQQQSTEQPSQPIPAYHSPLASLAGGDQQQEGSPSEITPDTRSLAGAQDLGIGMPRTEHSFWQPSVNVSSTFDSNALGGSGGGGWVAETSVTGGLDLHRMSENTDLTLNYIGGAMFSNSSEIGNSVTQEFELGDRFTFRRWDVSLFEQATYIPEAGFGYSGLGGLSGLGSGLGLQNGFVPDQSILTARGQRLANSSIAQADVFLTRRSSFTFLGGYSLLHFFDNDLLDYHDMMFQAGYNYQLNRQDTLALLYNFSGMRFAGATQLINDNKVNVSYGRRVTGRLAFQVAAGPEIVFFQIPISGSSAGSGGTSGTTPGTTKVYWSASTSLTYQFRRTGVGLAYAHGVNGGSGVLAGAEGDSVTGTASRMLSRSLNGGLRFGYSRNSGLNTASTPSNQTYGYWFAGGNLSHPWGRTLSLFVNYELEYQNSNSSFCVGPQCGESFVRHLISIGLGWRDHPFAF